MCLESHTSVLNTSYSECTNVAERHADDAVYYFSPQNGPEIERAVTDTLHTLDESHVGDIVV